MRRTATRSTRPLVFGRGGNKIQFASISDVATILERAFTDPTTRGSVIEVDGPSMTFDQLAASLAPELGAGARRPRHVPRVLLRCLAVAWTTSPGRQANAALIMDSYDLKTGKLRRRNKEPPTR
jgi:uncharacterized protein YbjT (DUF2867 family)